MINVLKFMKYMKLELLTMIVFAGAQVWSPFGASDVPWNICSVRQPKFSF